MSCSSKNEVPLAGLLFERFSKEDLSVSTVDGLRRVMNDVFNAVYN